MVCRTNTLNSALLSIYRLETGLSDVQTIGLLHSLQREGSDGRPAPTRHAYTSFLRSEMERVRDPAQTPSFTQARRASILRRLQRSIDSDTLPTGAMWWGQTQIADRARSAVRSQDRFIADLADRTGRSQVQIRESFNHYLNEGVPSNISRLSIPRREDPFFPADRHSQWAACAVENENGVRSPGNVSHCTSCGQFQASGHACPGRTESNQSSNGHRPRRSTHATRRAVSTRMPQASRLEPEHAVIEDLSVQPASTRLSDSSNVPLEHCIGCGQFIGVNPHTCAQRTPLPTSEINDQTPLIRAAEPQDVQQVVAQGGIATFVLTYRDDDENRTRATPPLWAGVGMDGNIEVWQRGSGRVPLSEYYPEIPQDVRDAITAHVNNGWDTERGRQMIEELSTPRAMATAPEATTVESINSTSDDVENEPVRVLREPGDQDPNNISFAQNMDVFQAAYNAACRRKSQGQEGIVPFMESNALGGLGDRDSGRGFGIEIEFNAPRGAMSGSTSAREMSEEIGRSLYRQGILATPHRARYHRSALYLTSDQVRDYWRFEADNSVSGGEIIAPISYDEPDTWSKIQAICDTIKEHGGTVSEGKKAGCHVHVGIGDYGNDSTKYSQFLRSMKANEDIIYRLAQNPHAANHRGTHWCNPNWDIPDDGFASVYQTRFASHYIGVNFAGANRTATGHVELRMWDGSLDPGVIQAQIKTSLAMVDRAVHIPPAQSHPEPTPIGSHSTRYAEQPGALRAGVRRAVTDEWIESTQAFRNFLDENLSRTADKEQITALFATTKWRNPVTPRRPRQRRSLSGYSFYR